jgi:hypothetical protein
LLLTLDVPHADGVRLQYRVLVRANGPYLCAQEDPLARRLPEFCPERHIVADGSFCMYWAGDRDQEARLIVRTIGHVIPLIP